MGEIRTPEPVQLIIAAFAAEEEAFAWGKERAIETFGPIWRESPTFFFNEFTDYYAEEMGAVLLKRFWAFERLIGMDELAAIKVMTNGWEDELARSQEKTRRVCRPLNLDPGYIDLGKLILASTKDHLHRIYLRDGIFAETTLYYSQKAWQKLPWTYPDYQSEGYQAFFTECRNRLRQLRRQAVR
ncbi:MAG: DUF4416 family protein [Thermoguttaceae bacterium]|nr:DUF4416 family protein [Thermoguttaceae bacterium]